jgi:hypothetical protein
VTVSRYYERLPLYLMTFQGHWEAQIYQTALPLWLRVYALGMARCEPNLHTGIGPDELAVLGETDPDGSRKAVDRRRLWEAIKKLVNLGWLDPVSDRNCLVLPAAGYACGRRGSKRPCKYHTGQHSKIKGDIVIVDREAEDSIEGESYRGVAKVQARAILCPEKQDKVSGKSGQAEQPAAQTGSVSGKSGQIDLVEVIA